MFFKVKVASHFITLYLTEMNFYIKTEKIMTGFNVK